MDKSEIKLRKERALKHYDLWLEAEIAVASSQSYTIGSRSLTRADLSDIRKQQEYWRREIDKLEAIDKYGGRNRTYIAVPRDI